MNATSRDVLRLSGIVTAFVAVAVVVGCNTLPPKPPELTAGVKTITVTKAISVPCIAAADIPPKFETSMPAPGPAPAGKSKVGVNAAGAQADVMVLKREHEKMRILLTQCTEVKP